MCDERERIVCATFSLAGQMRRPEEVDTEVEEIEEDFKEYQATKMGE